MAEKKRSFECECADGEGRAKACCVAADAQTPEAEQIYRAMLVVRSVYECDPETYFLDLDELERLAPELAKELAELEEYSFSDGENRDIKVSSDEYRSLVPKEADRLAPPTITRAKHILFRHGFQHELVESLYVSGNKTMRIVCQAVYRHQDG